MLLRTVFKKENSVQTIGGDIATLCKQKQAVYERELKQMLTQCALVDSLAEEIKSLVDAQAALAQGENLLEVSDDIQS